VQRQLAAAARVGSGDAASVKSTSDVSDARRECSSDADSTTYRPSGIGILEFSPDRAGLDVTPANLHPGSPLDRAATATAAARYSNKLSTVAGTIVLCLTNVYLRCMWSRIYLTVERPSVCLSHRSTASTRLPVGLLLSKVQKTEVCVEPPASALKTTLPAFAAERRRLRQISIFCTLYQINKN